MMHRVVREALEARRQGLLRMRLEADERYRLGKQAMERAARECHELDEEITVLEAALNGR